MEREQLLKRIAPCGLLCYTCTAAKDGAIQSHSRALAGLLESFDEFAERFSSFEPTLRKYPEFKEVLLLFATASCEGCRQGSAPLPDCPVSPCTKEREVDYCCQCEAFPCTEMSTESPLREKWLRANQRMREIGVEAYFDEAKRTSHYT